MCKQIDNTSKQGQRIAKNAAEYAYNHLDYTYNNIFEAYSRPSANKIRAWEHCKELCHSLNGYALRITGKSCHAFSAVFKFVDGDTGELCYCYMTRDYTRYCYA